MILKYKWFLLNFVWWICFPAMAGESLTWFLSKKESFHKWAVVPSYKRSGSLGHVIGGRVFIYPTTHQGVYLSGSVQWKPQRENFLSYKGNFFYWMQNRSEFQFQLEHDTVFDSLYKENSVNRVDVPSENIIMRGYYFTPWKGGFFVGGGGDVRYRKELKSPCFLIQKKENKKKLTRTRMNQKCYGFSDREIGASIRLAVRRDTRDQKFNPKKGSLIQGYVQWVYDFLDAGFFQTEIKAMSVFSLWSKEKWVLRLSGGGTLLSSLSLDGLIPYSYQFKLGGMEGLRGYRQGRFHSGRYYLVQAELRWPWIKWFETLVFLDIGSVYFSKRPNVSAGLGCLIGLPPHYNHRLRLEMGWGKDQYNFIVAFALPY